MMHNPEISAGGTPGLSRQLGKVKANCILRALSLN